MAGRTVAVPLWQWRALIINAIVGGLLWVAGLVVDETTEREPMTVHIEPGCRSEWRDGELYIDCDPL